MQTSKRADEQPEADAAALIHRLEGELAPPALAALRSCEGICGERGLRLYLVGGAVRDLLLGRPNVDLDLVIEGDVAPVAQAVAAATQGRTRQHRAFGTAAVEGAGFHLDVAQTRRESYARPGALPTVELIDDIEADLARRDFGVNAMALRLSPPVALIDPCYGLRDLKARQLRVLHERSFRDDATRMLRGVRYAVRLDFAIEAQTQGWLRRDLSYLQTISPARIHRELMLNLAEPSAPEVARLADELGVLRAIDGRLRLDAAGLPAWRDALAGRHHASTAELGLCLIADVATSAAVEALATRLALTTRETAAVRDFVRLRDASAKLAAAADDPPGAVELLDGISVAAVWALNLLDGGEAGRCCGRYLESWRTLRPQLDGKDLLALGVPAGERVGALLRRLRRARLTGEAVTRADEERILRAEIESK